MSKVEQSGFDVVRSVANVAAVITAVFAMATLVPACAYNPALAVASLFFPWLGMLDVCSGMLLAFGLGVGVRQWLSHGRDDSDLSLAARAVARLVWIVALLPPWLGSTSMVDRAEWGRSFDLALGWGALVLAATLLTSAQRASFRLVGMLAGASGLLVVGASGFLSGAYGARWLLAPGLALALVPLGLGLMAWRMARPGTRPASGESGEKS